MWSVVINILLKLWMPISFGLATLGVYFKGRRDQKARENYNQIQQDLETMKRLNDVQTNTDRDSALSRLRKSGNVRDN